jgi:hypothetical protein
MDESEIEFLRYLYQARKQNCRTSDGCCGGPNSDLEIRSLTKLYQLRIPVDCDRDSDLIATAVPA